MSSSSVIVHSDGTLPYQASYTHLVASGQNAWILSASQKANQQAFQQAVRRSGVTERTVIMPQGIPAVIMAAGKLRKK